MPPRRRKSSPKAARPAEDPRIAALANTLLAVLARELVRGPLARAGFDALVEYLDYIDHARYSHDEIAAFLDTLVIQGLARREGDTWTFA